MLNFAFNDGYFHYFLACCTQKAEEEFKKRLKPFTFCTVDHEEDLFWCDGILPKLAKYSMNIKTQI